MHLLNCWKLQHSMQQQGYALKPARRRTTSFIAADPWVTSRVIKTASDAMCAGMVLKLKRDCAHRSLYHCCTPLGCVSGSASRAAAMRSWVGLSGTPSFSASTTSAASVGAPTARNSPSLLSILASLHTAHTSATACKHKLCLSVPLFCVRASALLKSHCLTPASSLYFQDGVGTLAHYCSLSHPCGDSSSTHLQVAIQGAETLDSSRAGVEGGSINAEMPSICL